MPGDLHLETQDGGPVRVVRVAGSLSLPDVGALMAALTTALTAAAPHVVVCDVARLEAPLTDSLLTAFPAALRRSGGWPHASLHLAGAGPALAARLARQRTSRYLPVHIRLEDALAAARREAAATAYELALEPDAGSLKVVRTAVNDLWPDAAPIGPEEAALVAHELTANAIRHVAEPFTVTLAVAPARVLVAVSDPSRAEPVRHPHRTAGAPDGRGMHLVEQLSQDWGVRLVHPRGKTVWAALRGPVPTVPFSRPPSPA